MKEVDGELDCCSLRDGDSVDFNSLLTMTCIAVVHNFTVKRSSLYATVCDHMQNQMDGYTILGSNLSDFTYPNTQNNRFLFAFH